MARPVFDQAFKDNMELSLYQHSIKKLKDRLGLYKKFFVDAMAKNIVTVTHVVTDFDSLRTIAIKYYDDVTLWRKLAVYNKVDTTNLVTGTVLEIPDRKIINGL